MDWLRSQAGLWMDEVAPPRDNDPRYSSVNLRWVVVMGLTSP